MHRRSHHCSLRLSSEKNRNVDYQGQLSVALPTLTDKQLFELIPQLKMLTFQPGEIVIRQGEIADKFYILVEGKVEVIQELPNSESKLLKTLGPNTYFGEIGLLQETKRTATVRATNDAAIKVFAIERYDFYQMVVTSKMTHALLNYQAIKSLLIQKLKTSYYKSMTN
ncbi:MAG: cyclic nucleotide-binding domain-containing protein [Nostoc sp. DedQUE12a]|nr:cyclic nucleotide-binding domain-containing protein [Nostoc sp. DedQUE12a]